MSRCGLSGARSAHAPLSAQVFALIVFSCIFGEGYSNTHQSKQQYCIFNHNQDACGYGSAIGVLAFLASAFFLVVDAYFPQISNATDRKYLVIGDLLFSGTFQRHPALFGEVNRSSQCSPKPWSSGTAGPRQSTWRGGPEQPGGPRPTRGHGPLHRDFCQSAKAHQC